MYFWKCWRDSRAYFIGSLIALPAICVFFTVVTIKVGDPDAVRAGTSPSVVHAWATTTAYVLGGMASVFTQIWGLVLGSSGLGEEFKERTADFLLVRPRRRRYWVWMGWWVGVAELSLMNFLAVGATFATLTYLTGHVQTWRVLTTILPLAVGGAVIYSLTCFMTLVARSGRQGLSYSIGIVFIDLLLPIAVLYNWHVHMPSVTTFIFAGCEWATSPHLAYPFGKLALYVGAALAFPLAAQWVLERAEV